MKKLVLVMLAVLTVLPVFAGGKKQSGDLAGIKAAGKIVIGNEGTYPPFSYHDASDVLTGYDVDVAAAVAAKLGVKAEFIDSHWDSLVVGLDSGRWNIVANQVEATAARKEKYDFSIPYTYSSGVLIVRNDNETLKQWSDLKGRKWAGTAVSNWGDIAIAQGAEVVTTDGFNQSADLVVQGRADAAINDSIAFADYIKQHPDAPLKIVAYSDNVVESAIILAKGQPELVAAINKALTELLNEGKLKQFSEKYFGKDVSIPPK